MGSLRHRSIVAGVGLALLVLLLAAFSIQVHPWGHAFQEPILVGIDADPTDNSAASLGAIDPCISVAVGERFDVDVFVADVQDLMCTQGTFTYDGSILMVMGVDVDLLIGSGLDSRVVDLSNPVPDWDGIYLFVAADLGPSVSGESGSGLLARITLEAIAPGASHLDLTEIIVCDSAFIPMGDIDGDDFFDGPVSDAQVWVGQPCPAELPTLTPPPPVFTPVPTITTPTGPSPTAPATAPQTPDAGTPTTPSAQDEDDDGFPWVLVLGASAATLVAALASAIVLRWALRRAG